MASMLRIEYYSRAGGCPRVLGVHGVLRRPQRDHIHRSSFSPQTVIIKLTERYEAPRSRQRIKLYVQQYHVR